MRQREVLERAKVSWENYMNEVNPAVLEAYKATQKNGNQRLNFELPMREEEVGRIAANLKFHNFHMFSISFRSMNVTELISEFSKYGYEVVGTDYVKETYSKEHVLALIFG